MTSEPTDLDAVWRDATRDSMDANDNQERLRAALSALLDEVRRLRADYDDLHELYGKVIEQRDAANRQAEAAVRRVQILHQPYATPHDPHVDQRCRGCIAGYDPKTGELVHCAYPCPTIRALDGGDDQ